MTYKSRLLLAFTALIVLPVLAVLAFSQGYLREGLELELDQRLNEGLDGIAASVSELQAAASARLRAVNLEAEIARYQSAGDRRPLVTALQLLVAEGAFTIAEAGDTAGRVIARGHDPEAWGESKLTSPLVAAALSGISVTGIERGRSGLAIRAVRPLTCGSRPVGTLMGGYSLDARLAHQFRLLTGLETAFYLESESILTAPVLSGVPAALVERARAGGRMLATVPLGGHDWRIALLPIAGGGGAVMVALGRNLEEATRFTGHLQNALALLAMFGLLSALFTAFRLARGFSRPVEELEARMEELGNGCLAVRLPVRGDDEFGQLAGHFNRMAGRLETLTGQLKHAHGELLRSEKLAAAGRLTTEIAHEIRNPLNALAAQAELLKKDAAAGDRERAAARLRLVDDEIRRLNQIVSSWLQSLAPISLSRRPANLVATIRRACALVAADFEVAKIRMELRLPAGETIMAHDPELLHRVLLNLLRNAYESMPGGGTLTVTLVLTGATVAISICDTGIGMTAEEQQRAFEPFFTTKAAGTGLGLAFVLKVVEAHGGKVSLTTEPGAGTTVTIALTMEADNGTR